MKKMYGIKGRHLWKFTVETSIIPVEYSLWMNISMSLKQENKLHHSKCKVKLSTSKILLLLK